MMAYDLQPGSTLYACSDDGSIIPIKLASLFKVEGDNRLYALAGRSDRSLKNCKKVAVSPAQGSLDDIGTLAEKNPLDAGHKSYRDLFSVVTVDEKVASRLTLAAALTSKPKSTDIFSRNAVRLRKIVEPPAHTRVRGRNRPENRKYIRGYVAGQVRNPKIMIESAMKKVTLERAVIAASASITGRRAFAEPGDSGTPVLSGSRRLLGFVVARAPDGALLLPADDLAKACGLTFFSPYLPQRQTVKTAAL